MMEVPAALPHQDEAIDWAVERREGFVHLPTGSGKTRILADLVQIITEADDHPILIVTLNSLLEQTREELAQWIGAAWVETYVCLLMEPISIAERARILRTGQQARVYLLSHEAMSFPLIHSAVRRTWSALLVDEASKFRNWTRRTRGVLAAAGCSTRRFLFTGTPIVKTPMDVWYPAKILFPQRGATPFGVRNKQEFLTEYCQLGGWMNREPIGVRPDREEKLMRYLDSYRFFRTMADIREMPPRTFTTHRVTMLPEQQRRYAELVDTLRIEIEQADDDSFVTQVRHYITRMQRLQEIAAGFVRNVEGQWLPLGSAKLNLLVELLQEDRVPTIVWTWWQPELEMVCSALNTADLGHVHLARGGREDFNSGRSRILIAQMASGGYGLNLERADRMIYASLPWDLEVYLQSQERNYRLTSTRAKHVDLLVARNTIDERVRESLQRKEGLAQSFSRRRALELLR